MRRQLTRENELQGAGLAAALPVGACPVCTEPGRLLTWERRDVQTDAVLDRETRCLDCWNPRERA